MKTVLVLLLLFLLVGCDTFSRKPGRIGIPIPTKCEAKSVAVPTFALDLIPVDAPEPILFDGLVVERLQRIAYEIELIAAVKECQQ